MPLLGGRRADLQPREEDLIAMLPHDEGPHGTDQRLGQVQQDLNQEVERKGPGYRLAVTDVLIDEGSSDWVSLIQHARAVSLFLLTGEAAGQRVMVSGKRHDQHGDDQASGAQDEVQELSGAEKHCEVMNFNSESFDEGENIYLLHFSSFYYYYYDLA